MRIAPTLILIALALGSPLAVNAASPNDGPIVRHRFIHSGESHPHGPGRDDHGPPPARKQGCSVAASSTADPTDLLLLTVPLLRLLRRRR